ncbi:MAG: endonuclease/exonuclease/phosphatase family protein [Planctomycetota bacterium]
MTPYTSLGAASGAAIALLAPLASAGFVLDGKTDEWSADVLVAVDDEHLYLRVPFENVRAIYDEAQPTRVALDLDMDSSTGRQGGVIGVELQLSFTIAEGRWGPGRSLVITAYDEDGDDTELEAEVTRPLVAPTHASDAYEVRIARSAHPLLEDAGWGRALISLPPSGRGDEGKVMLESFERPAMVPGGMVDTEVPAKEEDSVRLIAHNVLWSNPEETAAPFSRMYQALDADIYLIQEWGRDDWSEQYERDLEAWFAAHVDPEATWTAVRSEAQGVAVVTPHPVRAVGPRDIRTTSLTRWDFPVRLVSAVVETPHGPFVVGSIHLKCCGMLGTPEDQRRFDEARAIKAEMGALAAAAGPNAVVVLGGDYNHNGHPLVAETAIDGLDADGSPLTLAETLVLGENAVYTWGGPTRGYRRSLLDFIAYADSMADVTAAFVLDTTILSSRSLAEMGLEPTDTDASDHLPVVVDLDPR